MSIFSTNSIHSMTNLSSMATTELSVHESMTVGSAAIIYESEANFTNMMKAIGIHEVNHYAQHGQVVVYEAGGVKGFIQKIIQFFKDLLKKIQALYNRFIAQMDAWVRSDKDFVKKYKSRLIQADVKGLKYKGFKFTTTALTMSDALTKTTGYLAKNEMKHANTSSTSIDSLRKWTKDWNDNVSDHTEGLRGAVIGGNKLTDKEFGEALFKLFRDGKDEKTEVSISARENITIIEGGEKAKSDAKKSMDTIKKNIESIISDLKKQETQLNKYSEKDSDDEIRVKGAAMAYVSALSNARKTQLQVIQKANGALMSALKHENKQAKSICVRILGHLPKKDEVQNNSGSLLEGVKFI